MTDPDQALAARVWDFLPARRDRRRTTVPVVIAAELGLPVAAVIEVLLRMQAAHHVVQDPRGSWHRGMHLPVDTKPAMFTQEELC
jgi:hypothetical protein